MSGVSPARGAWGLRGETLVILLCPGRMGVIGKGGRIMPFSSLPGCISRDAAVEVTFIGSDADMVRKDYHP